MDLTLLPQCGRCGATHPPESSAGLCPACLIRVAIGDANPGEPNEPARPSGGEPMVRIGSRINDYVIEDRLGEGGMGVVFRARQTRLNRTVALKMLPFGRFSPDAHQKRFHAEAQAIAQLRHPNIVTIFEIGEHDGQPFLSMEFVAGPDLGSALRERSMPVRDAAGLVERIARAIHYAHERGIAHRDLKPSNILLDADGEPHVTDFGLAKNLADAADLTLTGQLCGSPNYIPPEQAAGRRDADAFASDVYGLGAILYHLLTQRPPFVGATVAAVLHQLAEDEPVEPRLLNRAIPRDLETICLKCLEKEPGRRYRTANDVADELRRFLHDEPIRARPVGPFVRAWRWCRRRPALAAMAATTAVALSGGFATSLTLWHRAQERAQQAGEARLRAELDRVEDLFGRGESPEALARLARLLRERPADTGVAQRLVSALTHRNFIRPASPEFENIHHGAMSPLALSRQHLLSASASGRELVVWQITGGFTRVAELSLPAPARVAALTADGRHAAVALRDQSVQFWTLDESPVLLHSTPLPQPAAAIQLDDAGSRILVLQAATGVVVLEASTGRVLQELPEPHFAELSRDGRWFTAVTNAGAALWDAQTCEPTGRVLRHAYRIETARFSADSSRVVTAAADMSARIWNVDSGQPLGRRLLHQEHVLDAVLSPDGQRVLSRVLSNRGQLWDAVTANPIGSPFPLWRSLDAAQFSPDGLSLLACFHDRVWLRDAFSGDALAEPIVTGSASAVRFLDDGRRFVTTTHAGRAQLWSVQPGDAAPLILPHRFELVAAAFSPDGARVLTCAKDNSAQIWSAREGSAATPRLMHERRLIFGAFDPSGAIVATGDAGGMVRIWNAQSGTLRAGPLSLGREITALAFSRDGRQVVACAGRTAKVWSAAEGAEQFEWRHGGNIRALAVSADGRHCVTAGDDGLARLWNLATGERVAEFSHPVSVSCVDFSPDGRLLATGDGSGRIRFWSISEQRESGASLGHAGSVQSVRFSSTGRSLATASRDHTARVWDVSTRRPLTRPLVHGDSVATASISPDGRHVLTASADTTARVWRIATSQPVTDPLSHRNLVVAAEWSPNGRAIVTASWDGAGRVWSVPFFAPPLGAAEWLANVAETFGGLRLDPDEQPARVSRAGPVNLHRDNTGMLQSAEFDQWSQWLLADRKTRGLAPSSPISALEHARSLFGDNRTDRVRHALRLAPMDPGGLARWGALVWQQSSERNPRKQAEAAFATELAKKLAAAHSGPD